MRSRAPGGVLKLALWGVAAATILFVAASTSGLAVTVQRRVLLQPQPVRGPDLASLIPKHPGKGPSNEHSGRVEGATVRLAAGGGGGGQAPRFPRAYQLCRAPDKDAAPLPKLRRAVMWEGEDPTKDGNTTIVTTLHVEQ